MSVVAFLVTGPLPALLHRTAFSPTSRSAPATAGVAHPLPAAGGLVVLLRVLSTRR